MDDEFSRRGLGYRETREDTPEEVASIAAWKLRLRRSAVIHVSGFDTGLPKDDIKSALRELFGSCGEIGSLDITSQMAFLLILGEDARVKALGLNGSHVRGRKILVTSPGTPASEYIGLPPSSERSRGRPHCGFNFPNHFKYYKKPTE